MKNYKYDLNEIIDRIELEQKIVLDNDTQLIIKSKPFLKNEKYYVKCSKGNDDISIFCINYWYEKELVKFDSKDLFAKKRFFQKPYQNKCWKCQDSIDSNYCERCDICGWYICNNCNSCRKEKSKRMAKLCVELKINKFYF